MLSEKGNEDEYDQMANRRNSEQGGADDVGWPVFPYSQLHNAVGGSVQRRRLVTRNPYHWIFALVLGIRYDGTQDWGFGKLIAFTIRQPGPAQGMTFYLKKGELTFGKLRNRLCEKLEESRIATSA